MSEPLRTTPNIWPIQQARISHGAGGATEPGLQKFFTSKGVTNIGVATNRQEEAVASSCFDWPIANDKDFANGLKFGC